MIKRKLAAGIMLLVTTATLCSGCKLGKTAVVFTTTLSDKEVFRIEKEVCSIEEARVYLCNYQNIYGNAYGVNLWEHVSDSHSLEDYVKNITISELTRVVCMDELAKKQEMTLTADEKDKAAEAAAAYYDSLSKKEIAYMDVSESTLESMYEDYALAQKLYRSLTDGVNEEVSDDEARIMEAMQIYVSSKEKADKVKADLDAGRDFTAVATDYNEASKIEITFGRGDMPSQVEKAAFELDDDAISGCIKTDDGYYFIKCTNKFDQELTDANKANIVKKREKEAFDDVYDSFVRGLDSTMNEKLWDQVEIKQDKDITTNSFFEVYDEYFQS